MSRLASLKTIGPGIVIAATGVGAGDLIAASVSGARFGTTILWAALLGAVIKFVINENLARWQLATGTTLLEGWIQKLPRFVSVYFLAYLLLWSFIVAGALISATGLAAHALIPALSVEVWGILHSLAAAIIVWFGAYRTIENLMKWLVAMMSVVVVVCAIVLLPPSTELLKGMLIPRVPEGSIVFILGVIGGVGGTVTVMSYGYWIRERQWQGGGYLPQVRVDLAVAYGLTGLFGIAVMIISAGVHPDVVKGSKMILGVADYLGTGVGPVWKWLFLLGFWGAVFSSMVGVWAGVPYLFTDFVLTRQGADGGDRQTVSTRSPFYRLYLAYLTVPPMLLLLFGKPVWVIVLYSVSGALFMPFLAALLVYMNNRTDWVGKFRNRWLMNGLLIVSIVLFGALLIEKISRYLEGS